MTIICLLNHFEYLSFYLYIYCIYLFQTFNIHILYSYIWDVALNTLYYTEQLYKLKYNVYIESALNSYVM